MRNRDLVALLAALFVALSALLAGCGGSGAPPATTRPSAGQTTQPAAPTTLSGGETTLPAGQP